MQKESLVDMRQKTLQYALTGLGLEIEGAINKLEMSSTAFNQRIHLNKELIDIKSDRCFIQ